MPIRIQVKRRESAKLICSNCVLSTWFSVQSIAHAAPGANS